MSDAYLWGLSKSEAMRLLRKALRLPPVVQATGATLVLKLGETSIGWTMLGQSFERCGAALDLTEATVKLHGRRVLEAPDWAGRYQLRIGAAFEVAGTLVTAEDGEVSFTLDADDFSGASGVFLIEPRVTLADGTDRVPGWLRIELQGRVS